MLVGSNGDRAHFAHVASHDMQEHLRMVLSFGTLLAEEYGPRLDERGRQWLTLSLHAARQLRELLDDMVEYDGMDGGGHAGTFDAMAQMEVVLEGLTQSIQAAGAEIAVAQLPDVPGNPVRFRRLMQNLVGNAVKYVAPQTRPCIRITAEDAAGCWRFCVKDNGIGIEPAYFRKIFEPFERLHSRARYAGTGLGLAICGKIVAGFGGRIWVESAPGAGSSFYFTIPKKVRAR
jgi:light-regulated signal transduction histidine kinase (bacteriophytochrome)